MFTPCRFGICLFRFISHLLIGTFFPFRCDPFCGVERIFGNGSGLKSWLYDGRLFRLELCPLNLCLLGGEAFPFGVFPFKNGILLAELFPDPFIPFMFSCPYCQRAFNLAGKQARKMAG